jgi:hypothetical protein
LLSLAYWDGACQKMRCLWVDGTYRGAFKTKFQLPSFAYRAKRDLYLRCQTERVGDTNAPVEYAGPVQGLVGLDQLNLRLPRTLAGRGEAAVEVQTDGKKANPVKVLFE